MPEKSGQDQTSKITAVDYNKRTVTIQSPSGAVNTYSVTKDVTNLNQVKVGDILNTSVSERLAIYATKGGGAPNDYEVFTLESAPQGSLPGFVATDTLTIIGKVKQIDYNTRKLTLSLPNNQQQTFQVNPHVGNLSQVHVGDDVVAQYTQSLTMTVQSPTR